MNFLTHLNLNNNELQNVTVQNLATAPGSPKPGQMYFSTANNTLQVWDGEKWLAGGTSDIPTLIIENINGLQGALDAKAGKSETTVALGLKETITGAESKIETALNSAKEYTDSKVKTDVPAGAIFTDTVPTLATLKLDKVDNTSDANKPVSTAQAAALALKADTTALSTSLANTLSEAKTHAEGLITDLIDGAPENLDTLKELAKALANDASYSSTILSKLALKPDKKVEAVGNGTKTSYVITHDFGTRDVNVTVRETGAPYAVVYTDIEMTTETEVTVKFAKAPLANQYTVTIIG